MTMPRPPFRAIFGSMFTPVLCLLLALAGASALAADESKGKEKDQAKARETEKSSPSSPSTKRAGKSHTVTITGNKYAPAAMKIKVGETVVWTNDDDKDHAISADDKSFKSDNLSPGDEFKHMFAKAGTFKYACRYHPREKGTVTVDK